VSLNNSAPNGVLVLSIINNSIFNVETRRKDAAINNARDCHRE
jgi:hypothetical protein